MPDLDQNRATVIAFHEIMFNACRPREAIERDVGADDIQHTIPHTPHVETGTEGFIACFERMARECPGKRVEVERAIAEGDLVVLHCHQIWPGGDDYAGIDIFRLDADGKIVEHWDVLQTMPSHSANSNGMF